MAATYQFGEITAPGVNIFLTVVKTPNFA